MQNKSKRSFMIAVCIALAALLAVSMSGCAFEGILDWYESAGTTKSPYASKVPSGPLASLSWADIDTLSRDGTASVRFTVGDEKEVTLSTGETLTFVILGFNHDNLANADGMAGITFGMKDCMAGSYFMNYSPVVVLGGWDNSDMRTVVLPGIFDSLPTDLEVGFQ